MFEMVLGTRRQGGQKKLWMDDITKWLTPADETRVTVPQAVQLAQDRTEFRRCIHTAWHSVDLDGTLLL